MFNKLKEKWLEFKKAFVGLDEFDLHSDDAYNKAVFGTTDSVDKVFRSIICNINSMIMFKADHGSKCLVVELNEGESYLRDRILNHYKERGFTTDIISGAKYNLENDLLVLLFNKKANDKTKN